MENLDEDNPYENGMPRPQFPEGPLEPSGRASPPKRPTGIQRKMVASPREMRFSPLGGSDPPDTNSTLPHPEINSFYNSDTIPQTHPHYNVDPNTLTDLDLIDSIENPSVSSNSFEHPYAQHSRNATEFYDNTFTESSGVLPLQIRSSQPLPTPIDLQPYTPKEEEEEEEYVSPPRTKPKKPTPIQKPRPKPQEKATKGLRNLSYRVVEKVEDKGTTTYNQVSEELVEELKAEGATTDGKNIKRRVYDALNVLRAIQIITKDKKQIRWEGLPQHSAQALTRLQKQKEEITNRIAQKRENYDEAKKQLRAYKLISSRNRQYSLVSEDKKIEFPFILASSPSGSQIDCEMAENRTEYCISFQNPFKLYTEVQLLEMMNLQVPSNSYDYAPDVPAHISPSFITGPPSL